MNLALLLPAALAALAAVLLPLLIHLARRSEQRPTVFAALQWLRRKPKPRHRIRFDEWPLLLVRLLLLILLALLLARPVVQGAHNGAPWVVVAPGAAVPRDRTSIAPAHARWHRLAPGFPPLDLEESPGSVSTVQASPTSVLRELDATLPPGVAITVLVPPVLDGVDAERPMLSRPIDWRAVASTVEGSAGSLRAGDGASATGKTAGRAQAPPSVSVRFADERTPALRYIRAALASWATPETGPPRGAAAATRDIGPVTEALPADARHLIWLAPGALPDTVCDWVSAGGTALLDAATTPCTTSNAVAVWRDASGVPLVESAAHGRGRVMRFTRELAPTSMPLLLEGAFPLQLRALFEPAPPPPARVRAVDHAPASGSDPYVQPPRDLAPWLIVLIALVFLVERIMATGPRRGVAA